MNDLKLIVMDNIAAVGKEVDEFLQEMNKHDKSYMMEHVRTRFNNGEGKIGIDETARDKDVFKSMFKPQSKYVGEPIDIKGSGEVTFDE